MFWLKTRSKKELNEEIKVLKSQLANSRLETSAMTNQRNEWRAKYELILLTPEYKLDAEAAFQRGVTHARIQFRNWLIESSRQVDEVLKDSNEK